MNYLLHENQKVLVHVPPALGLALWLQGILYGYGVLGAGHPRQDKVGGPPADVEDDNALAFLKLDGPIYA